MFPELFTQKMKTLLGEESEAFFAALDRPRAVGLRLNPLKLCGSVRGADGALLCSARDPAQQSESAGSTSQPVRIPFSLRPIPWEPTGFFYEPEDRPGLHPYHAAGAYYLQEPSAMAPAALLDPQPGERILDLCAAPGGKTTQLAGRMRGSGLIVCNEIHPKRAAALASNVERLGIANALVLNEHPNRLTPRFASFFDRILVDAPCSGEGMFRKHDAAFQDWSPETVAMCAKRQAEILDCAAEMLRPGGRLVYSTCTFSPEENEKTVAAFLTRHPDFAVARVEAPWFSSGHPDWADGTPALSDTFRLWPHKLLGEGHFAAVLHKCGDRAGERCSAESAAKLPKPVMTLLRELGIQLPDGIPVVFGERVFLAPPELPELRGLKVLRPGLELAELRRELAIPAHALALWAKNASACQDLCAEDPACAAYLSGNTLPTQADGWTLVRVDGLSLGWGKGVHGVLKNHYPKGLRIAP